jgi:hypothetical protein
MLEPPAGAESTALGEPTALVAGRGVEQVDLGERGMQADQHRVRFQHERVADGVLAAGKVEHAVGVDGLLDRGGVVGDAVALDAEGVDVDPFFRRAGARGWPAAVARAASSSGTASLIRMPIFARHAFAGHDEAIVEALYLRRPALAEHAPFRSRERARRWARDSSLRSRSRSR